jgi:hypothetical protein
MPGRPTGVASRALKGEVKDTTVSIEVRITNSNYQRLAQ